MHISTIIAKNYVAQARVLARSFLEHNPNGTCWVLVIDDVEGYIDGDIEPFELVTAEDLGIERFDRMAALYDVLELSTAVKPWLLRHLLHDRDCERVCYLDPDIKIYSSLSEVDALLRDHRVVVIPHITDPLPPDGKRPSETDLLVAGAYNLGFIGVAHGPDTELLLDWWSERLERDCIVAPERGYFVDQRWMDFAPGLIKSFHVLRDPGYNVAYWNLPSRRIGRRRGGYVVDGRPLRFFHFSGYNPDRPHELSLHQDRIVLRREPVLRELCDAYAEDLRREGIEEAREWPYTYAHLPDGTPLDNALRAVYRELEAEGAFQEYLFSADGVRRFFEALNAPVHGRGPDAVTRYLKLLWLQRPDLQDAFPDIEGADGPAYVTWARVLGRNEVPIPPRLLPGVSHDGASGEAPSSVVGVNVIAYLRSVLGVGEHGRQLVKALMAQGVPVAQIAVRADASYEEEPAPEEVGAPYPVNLLCVNADMVPVVAANMPGSFFRRRHTIGFWAWEVSSFPEKWLPSFGYVNEVWVGSRHVADALGAVAPVPVVKIPQPVSPPPASTLDRQAAGLPEGPLFLFSFDYLSVFQRKNPLAVVAAFADAFPEPGRASLVIKTINHESDERNHAQLIEAADGLPHVQLIDRYLPREENLALLTSCDCYVSLHRAEGFGIPLAEAMAAGKPVIATAYSGNLEFMTPYNSYLVDYRLAPIGDGADPYPPEGEWADPDVEHASRLMRHVVDQPEEARVRAERGRREIMDRHSPQAAGVVMVERLRRVYSRSGVLPRHGEGAAVSHTTYAERRVRSGPPPPAPGTRKPRQILRKGLLRMLKPYTAHQRAVDEDILRVLRVLEESIQGLGSSVDTLRAEVQPALRLLRSFGPAAQGAAATATLPAAPRDYWTPEYIERHREFISRVLDEPQLLMSFKRGRPLPPGYGVRFDERVVEIPWILTRDLSGRILDAGSTLNHPHLLARIRPRVEALTIATLAPEPEAYPFLDVSYLYADLRDLPIRDETYDRVVCISTLEHVGMDTSQYGTGPGRSDDPRADVRRTIGELRRVLRPGGVLYLSVPYGAPEDHGWLRQFGPEDVQELMETFAGSREEHVYYGYQQDGWRLYEDPEPLGGRTYRDHFSQPSAEDGAAAARAVVCVELRKQR